MPVAIRYNIRMSEHQEGGPSHIEQFAAENTQEVTGALVDAQNMFVWGVLGILNSFIPAATLEPESAKHTSSHGH